MNTPGPKEIFPEAAHLQLAYMESDPDYAKQLLTATLDLNTDKYVVPHRKNPLCRQLVNGEFQKRRPVKLRYLDLPIAFDTEFNSYTESGECVMYAGVLTIGNPASQQLTIMDPTVVQNRKKEVVYQNTATPTVSILFRTPEQFADLLHSLEEYLDNADKEDSINTLCAKMNKRWFIRERNKIKQVDWNTLKCDLDDFILQGVDLDKWSVPELMTRLKDCEESDRLYVAIDGVKCILQQVREKMSELSHDKVRSFLYEEDIPVTYTRYIVYAHNSIADLPTIQNAGMKVGSPHIMFSGVSQLVENEAGECVEETADVDVELSFKQLNQDKFKPITAHFGRMEYRCSYQLTGRSLEDISKSFNIPWLRKSHDLDYKLVRNSKTELSNEEIKYCHLDGLILCHLLANEKSEIHNWMADADNDTTEAIYNIPITSTNKAKRYTMSKTVRSTSHKADYKSKMTLYTCTFDEYMLGRDMAYRGGFTHASAYKSGQILFGADISEFVKDTIIPTASNVSDRIMFYGVDVTNCIKGNGNPTDPYTLKRIIHIDFTSSYPAVLCMEMYPIGRPKIYRSMTLEKYKELAKEKLIFAVVTCRDIILKKNAPTSYLPCDGNCRFKDPDNEDVNEESEFELQKDNGRLVKSPYYQTALTNTDIDYALLLYDFKEMRIEKAYVYNKAYLPIEFVEAILDLYYQKTQLKEQSKHDQGIKRQYNALKALLNSIYGMCVKRLLRDGVEFDDDKWWTIELTEEEKENIILDSNKLSKKFNNPLWGVFCTAYARRNLWLGIKHAGKDFIYCDTDSIFSYENDSLMEFINEYNNVYIPGKISMAAEGLVSQCTSFTKEEREEKMQEIIGKFNAQDSNGIVYTLGAWDWEDDCIAFKTLGSKRYLQAYYDKKLGKVILEATVAGCPKGPLSARFQELYDGYVADGCPVREALVKTFEYFSEGLSLIPRNEYAEMQQSGIHMSPNWFTYKEGEKEKTRALYFGQKDSKTGKIRMSCDRDVTDYQGNTEHVAQRYGMCIIPAKFQLTIPDEYNQYIEELLADVSKYGSFGE